ncbi:hypothetical protein G6F43_006809 [Rhizopus delemar]|nr:hypothetical protein G6F43_006809 [Rhizopus delemar]
MIIFKPEWVSHSDNTKRPCIYSVDVHPDGSQLATGGLDGTIKVWNTAPIYYETAEQDPNCPKLICTLSLHKGAVSCVRYSNKEGHYLASCSDQDNLIIVWTRGSESHKEESQEHAWLPNHHLIGHKSDVQGLAWSKDNECLASCDSDGTIIIWDGKTFEQVKKIDKHEGSVKGIIWDPAGKYLASQSDDKTVKIWRVSDWGLEASIKNPFIHSPGTAFFKRLRQVTFDMIINIQANVFNSWSPDGGHVAAADGINTHKHVAAIVARDDWNTDVSLVGHKHPVEVTSFNPRLFYMYDDAKKQRSISSICALGSQDRSVSIWVTKFSKPICVAADIFDNNVYDIAWAPDGKSLFACSQDGTVACLQLQEELDDAVPEEIVMTELVKYGYGKNTIKRTPVQEKSGIEGVQQGDLSVNEKEQEKISAVKNGEKPAQPIPSSLISNGVKEKNTSNNIEVTSNKRKGIEESELESKSSRAKPNWIDSPVVPPIVQKSQIKMALPKIRPTISIKSKEDDLILECQNTLADQNSVQSKVSATRQGATVWIDYLSSASLVLASNKFFAAIGCEDGSIHTYSPAGKRLLPAIVLESPGVLLQSYHSWLVCITATGLLYSWDVLNLKSAIEGISIAPILQVAQLEAGKMHEGPRIKAIRIQKDGMPILVTNSHQAFVYHVRMKVWLRISDAWYILSEFWGISGRHSSEDHPLAWLSSHVVATTSHQTLLDMSATTKVLTISHIETQLAVAALLNSPAEYKDWMIYYAKRLSEENAKQKAEELCKWLTGPPYIPSSDIVKWEPTIMGEISKKDLLNEILPLLAKNRQLQRTVIEFTNKSAITL